MNLLGADYTNALAENAASRVNGLYNDANVTACLFFSIAVRGAVPPAKFHLRLSALGRVSAGGRPCC